MKTLAETRQLADWLGATDLGLLELVTPDGALRLGRDDVTGAFVEIDEIQASNAARASARHVVSAPSVGIFRSAHPLDPLALAALGAKVSTGQAVGLLQVGPLLLPLIAPCDGTVAAVQVEDGASVGYGQPLITLR